MKRKLRDNGERKNKVRGKICNNRDDIIYNLLNIGFDFIYLFVILRDILAIVDDNKWQ